MVLDTLLNRVGTEALKGYSRFTVSRLWKNVFRRENRMPIYQEIITRIELKKLLRHTTYTIHHRKKSIN